MDRDKTMVSTKGISVCILGILLFSSILGLFFTRFCSAAGSTIYIDDSNMVEPWDGTQEHPYQHINEGIAAATPGDTVFVFSGTYTENVVITKNLTLTGESKDTTFIDGGGNGHVLHIYGSDTNSITVHVSGFSIRNAGDTFACIAGSYMINNEITNNKINSINGYGIQLYNCQGVTISDNLISGNIFMGVNVYLSIQNIITNNIIQNNQEGIYLYYDSNYNEITDNAIRDNSESGVRVVQSSNNVFSRNNFVRNCPNAQDPSVNTWSKDGQGNYWDDYSGYDNNSDGIGDIPYNIPGGNNKDYYPLGYFKQPEPPGGGNQPPIAFIPLASVTTAFFGDPITFNGDGTDSDGTIVGYYWRSNLDGFLSTQQSFTTTTLSIGTHTIYFKVQDNAGAWSQEQSTSVTIDSRVNHPPTASIDAITPNPVKQGQPVLFRGHGTDDDGTLIAYSWLSSKDGVIGTISSCIVRNLTIGTHTIYFKVKDNMNEWSSPATMTLIIEQNSSMDPSNHAPSANIGGPYQGVINQTIVFNASRSSDSDGTVQSYVWSFGDTSSGTGPSPMHTYTIPGTYRVTVQVTDNDGVSSTASTSVIITQSASQGNNPNGVIDFILSIPFPVIIVIMALSILGIIGMFIHWMKKR